MTELPTQQPTSLADTIAVSMTLSLDTVVDTSYLQVGEEDWSGSPVTILDVVISRAARQLVEQITHDALEYKGVRSRVQDAFSNQIGLAVAEIVKTELDKSWVPVDENGVPTGVRTTLVEKVLQSAKEMLSAPPLRSGGGYDYQKTTLGAFIEATTREVIAKELRPVLAQAKTEIVTRVRESFSAILAEEVIKAVSK